MEVKTKEDALKILGFKYVPENEITTADIQQAYHRLVKQVHPDTGGTDELFQILNQAYEILTGNAFVPKHGEPAHRACDPKPESKSAKGRHILSILSDRHFKMPSKDFVKACCGAPQYVRYGDADVRIGWNDILYYYVRCEIDVKYCVKLYKNWLSYFLDRPYSETVSDNRIANHQPSSTRFKTNVIINTRNENPKYYRIYVDVPDAVCGTFFEGRFEHETVLTRLIRDKVCDKLSFDFRILLS